MMRRPARIRTMTSPLPTRAELKAQARRLRDSLTDTGQPLSHSQALEAIARQWGARDWNTLAAAAPDTPPATPPKTPPESPLARWQVGARVRGRYLGHAFSGRIKAASEASGGYWHLTVVFDQAVDVVASRHFSNLRRQISCVLNGQGVSAGKTSDGTPHMVLFSDA
jgi:hypothetical protein